MLQAKLRYTIGLLAVILVLTGAVSVYLISRIEKDVIQLSDVATPLEKAVLEMKTSLIKGFFNLITYAQKKETISINIWRARNNEFKTNLIEFQELADTSELKNFSVIIRSKYQSYEAVGGQVIDITEHQFEKLSSFREKVREISDIINSDLKPFLSPSQLGVFLTPSQVAMEKRLQAFLQMELSINRTFAAIQGYLAHPEISDREDAASGLTDFQLSIMAYKKIRLSADEKSALENITITFAETALTAAEIIDLEDQKVEMIEALENAFGQLEMYIVSQVDPVLAKNVMVARDHATQISEQTRIMFIVAAIVGLIGGLAALVITRRIVESLAKLTKGAEKIGEGDLEYRIDIESRDEIGHLASTFNKMSAARKKAENNIQIAAEKYHTLFEFAHDGIVIFDPGTRQIVEANEIVSKRLGYSREEFLTFKIDDFIQEGFDPDTDTHYREMLLGKSVMFERLHKRKNGSLMPVEVSGKLFLYHGRMVIQAVIRDITSRKKADEELKLAAKVFENSSEGVMVCDNKSVIQSVNPAFTQITGYGSEEVVGKTPQIFKSGRHSSVFYKSMWQSLIKTGAWRGEIWNRRKNGEIYPESLSISAIKDEVGKTVQYAAVFADITELKNSQEELKHQAFHDALTGLPNRNLFQDRLNVALSHAHRSKARLAVMFIDLDNFKHINDSLGHATGDLLLKKVAIHLIDCVREDDTVARLGGDEFIIIVEQTEDVHGPINIAKRILEKLSEPISIKGHDLYAGASIGITYYPEDGDDVETLIRNADMAMYRAKDKGKNNFQLFTPAMNEQAIMRLDIETSLRKAMDRKELHVYYQPMVDIESQKIVGMEALMRWRRFDTFMPPSDFIPIAEESGLIVEMGAWILEEACRQTKSWHDEGFDFMNVSVNLSARQIEQIDFIENVKSILVQTRLPPENLELEVTESAVMTNVDRAIDVMRDLNDMGIRISIDDFGTGYSSLSYLKQFPIHKLKIDRSFVMDIPHNKDDCAITQTVISMGHSLGLKVIAEGVETQEQFDFLALRHCDQIQGYFFNKPVPAEEFHELLAGDGALIKR